MQYNFNKLLIQAELELLSIEDTIDFMGNGQNMDIGYILHIWVTI